MGVGIIQSTETWLEQKGEERQIYTISSLLSPTLKLLFLKSLNSGTYTNGPLVLRTLD